MRDWPMVSVVTPVYNARAALPRLLASLAAQMYPADRVEHILVDNNSTDSSLAWLHEQPGVIALSQGEYQTPGATRNVGLRAARGEVIALIDADCWADPDWLANGVRRLMDDGADRVAGRVQFVFSVRPNIYELFDSNVNFQQHDFVGQQWCGTGNLFFRRRLLDEVGYLDPALRSAEDYEFGVRATKRGKTLAYAADAVVRHETRRSFAALWKKFVRTGYGCGQIGRRYGYFATSLFYRKANYRPVGNTWRDFVQPEVLSPRERAQVDLLWNALRMASNWGNFLGYFDLLRAGRGTLA